jgi:hypothetical protein
LALTPDSGLLTPESSLRETRARVEVSRDDAEDHAEWLTVLEAYPTGAVRSDLIGAERAARRLVESGDATWQALRDGAGRYAAVCRATDRIVMNPVKFFTDDDKPWSQAWPIPPPKKSFVQQQQDGMAERFLRGVS